MNSLVLLVPNETKVAWMNENRMELNRLRWIHYWPYYMEIRLEMRAHHEWIKLNDTTTEADVDIFHSLSLFLLLFLSHSRSSSIYIPLPFHTFSRVLLSLSLHCTAAFIAYLFRWSNRQLKLEEQATELPIWN